MQPNLKSAQAKDIKEGDVIAFCLFGQWHLHRVEEVSSNGMGNILLRTNNDTATFIREPNERISIKVN